MPAYLVADIEKRGISLFGAKLVGAAAGIYVQSKELKPHGEYLLTLTMAEEAERVKQAENPAFGDI